MAAVDYEFSVLYAVLGDLELEQAAEVSCAVRQDFTSMISIILRCLFSSCFENTTIGNASVTRSMSVLSAMSYFLLHKVTIRRHVASQLLEWMVVSTV